MTSKTTKKTNTTADSGSAVKRKPARKLRVLFASPESVPFASTGGLGEVAGSLPKALNDAKGNGIECRVILPLYSRTGREYRDKMRFLGTRTVDVSWRKQYMGLFELRHNGVTYYFIDNEFYFARDDLYGYYDDGERFSFFSRAVFEALELMDFVPDVIHANDWQTALIPVFQNSLYKRDFMKTVFTVHNIEYQGYYDPDAFDAIIGLPESDRYLLEFGEGINLMKGGIEGANIFSTVSPSYAEELKDPAFAFGMDGIVRRNSHKLRGILNGIDIKVYDPSRDKYIAAKFSAEDISGKAVCKSSLQKSSGLPVRDVPMITLVSRLVPAKGMDLIREVLDDILNSSDAQFVMLGTGFPEYENFFRGLAERHPDKAACHIGYDTAEAHRIYAGGDILLVPSRSEPCGLTQMIGCRYADIPVVRETGGLRDSITDCTLGGGNGFVFSRFNSDDLMRAIQNALVRYADKSDWADLAVHDLSLDFGWNASAKKYATMYKSLFDDRD